MSIRIDTGAEKAKGNVSRGDLNPLLEADYAVDWNLDDVVKAAGVVNFRPRVRGCDEF
jgi:hypothetical protein